MGILLRTKLLCGGIALVKNIASQPNLNKLAPKYFGLFNFFAAVWSQA